MINTFTLPQTHTKSAIKTEQITSLPEFADPSALTITNILNYSKNLEVKPSNLIENVELIKS